MRLFPPSSPLHPWAARVVVAVVTFVFVFPLPLAAQNTSAMQPDLTSAVAQARDHLKAAEYDQAIELLREAIDGTEGDVSGLREAYLQLAETFVQRGNSIRSEPQSRTTAELYYQEAREVIAQCLSVPELRHTAPNPPSDYPPRLVRIVEEERERMFGSFRVVELEPPEAIVYLDDARLPTLPDSDLLGDTDIPVGTHIVTIQADGYKEMKESVEVSPGGALEKSYALDKGRGPMWWLTRGVIVAGAAVVLYAIGDRGGTTSDEPLPDPPPPPPGP